MKQVDTSAGLLVNRNMKALTAICYENRWTRLWR
jgi:hypothetical protein